MKHRVLIEFESDKPLPADFTDQIAGRVYNLDLVLKKECTATLLDGDILKAAERYGVLRSVNYQIHEDDISVADSSFNVYFGKELDSAVDALQERYAATQSAMKG